MKARVIWLPHEAGGREALPTGDNYSTVARFPEDDDEWSKNAWSVLLDFTPPASTQGNPSIGKIRFLAAEAPAEQLSPGRTLQLCEGERVVADVEILEE